MGRELSSFLSCERLDEIGETTATVLWRGRRRDDEIPVLLKVPRPGISDEHDLRREHDLLRTLALPGLLRPLALSTEPGHAIMVLESVPGESLRHLLDTDALDWRDGVQIAAQLARVLDGLHAAGWIHGDLRPGNVLVSPDHDDVWLTDLCRAVPEDDARVIAAEPDWAYVSPEQTGRLGRGVDRRSDFYSLGVLLYRMTTGVLPFAASDALGWTHCHVARRPPAPLEIAPTISPALSAVVMKLLAKQPDDRYQSARGLRHDLGRCHAGAAPFPLATRDVAARLVIPHRVYGRDRERTCLGETVARVATSGRPEIVLLSGPAGIGKSSLAETARAAVTELGGTWITGKFDPHRRHVPYAALGEAFRELLIQIAAGGDEVVAAWRRRLERALGDGADVVHQVIPEMSWLLEPAATAVELPAMEARNRLLRVLRRLIAAVAEASRPLVVFLDDVQWADAATLAVLEHLVAHDDTRDLLVVLASRDGDGDERSPPSRMVAALRRRMPVEEIRLGPLDQVALARLLADTFGPGHDVAPLAALVAAKTAGNPFFVHQFLHALRRDRALAFDAERGAWRWDLDRVRNAAVTDNVVDLMIDRLGALDPATREALTRAACLGDHVDLTTLARISAVTPEIVEETLRPALREGLLVVDVRGDRATGRTATLTRYRWSHDRVQQAAYSLIPRDRLAGLHLAIARLLRARRADEDRPEEVFELADHFHRGAALITDSRERIAVAELDLAAGRRAAATHAYASAAHYLALGRELAGAAAWTSHRALAWQLHRHGAEAELLDGHPEVALGLLGRLLDQAASPLERAEVHGLKLLVHLTRGEVREAVACERSGLAALGIELPPAPSWDVVAAERARVRALLAGRRPEALTALPALHDPAVAAALRLHSPSYFVDSRLYCVRAARMVALCLEHGNSDAAALWYGTYGFVLAGFAGEYVEARGFAMLAAALSSTRRVGAYRAAVCFLGAVVRYWTDPIDEVLELARSGFDAGVEIGDFTSAVYCGGVAQAIALVAGTPLAEVLVASERYLAFARQAEQRDSLDVAITVRQLIRTLQGKTRELGRFDDDDFSEERFEAGLAGPRLPTLICWYWIFKLRARFTAGDLAGALAAADAARPLLWASAALVPLRDYHLYAALARADAIERDALDERGPWIEEIQVHHDQIQRWAAINPSSFRHLERLVGAELARLRGDDTAAERLYDDAIGAARDGGFFADEALTSERAAAFQRGRGRGDLAEAYLREARAGYARWGAHGKVRQLDQAYPQLGESPAAESAAVTRLDLLAAIKASQAISGEIVLDRLITTLMRVVIESAGARRGLLLLARGDHHAVHVEAGTEAGGLGLAAEARVQATGIEVTRHPVLPAEPGAVPWAVIRYVHRTGGRVLLADATAAHPFRHDPYFAAGGIRSVVCLSIVRQGEVTGVLYLENELVVDAFTPERMTALELLASQAAISLDNARLYHRLEEENAERRRAEEALRASQEALRQSQKMEAIGQLAGGVAHDFNNLLSVIIGYSQMLIRQDVGHDPQHDEVREILRAAERAAGLTRQLLAFSRRQRLSPRVVDLDVLVRDAEKMLRRLIGEDIDLRVHGTPGLGRVRVDPGQIEQVIVNLAVNARDAMPRGGTLALTTRDIDLEVPLGDGNDPVPPGRYVVLAVSDTGVGMEPAVRARIFEPFFTTKPLGQGSGLGLATVYGIVKQSLGFVRVDTASGLGTTFSLYFPRIDLPVDSVDAPPPRESDLRGSETVLVVEDQDALRDFVHRYLEELGYHVLVAANAGDALALARDQRGIDVLLTDVVMPHMSGFQLATNLRAFQPDLRVVYMSGYSVDVVEQRGLVDPGELLLEKPFAPQALAATLREALARAG